MNVRLHTITPDAEATIIEIARVSSSRENKREDIAGLIRYLINNKHWSPFEHGFMTVKIKTSRAIATQFLRHRSFTFQQFSLRYAKASGFQEIDFRLQAEKNRQSSTESAGYIDQHPNGAVRSYSFDATSLDVQQAIENARIAVEKSVLAYEQLIAVGIAKECARFVLPLAITTTLYMTGPIRSWIHLVQLRDEKHAQKEAQDIAQAIKVIFTEQLPIISEALGWQ